METLIRCRILRHLIWVCTVCQLPIKWVSSLQWVKIGNGLKHPGPSCSKLTMSLVNDSLKFTSSDMQICWYFLLKNAKATHIFSAKNIRILYIESAKTFNEMTLNELVKLTTLWTTGPRWLSGWCSWPWIRGPGLESRWRRNSAHGSKMLYCTVLSLPPPRSATFFCGDWSWNIFYGHSLPSADSRRAVVSFWRKNVHNTG